MSLTERGCTVRTVHVLEEAFREYVHLEELAPLAHDILLARDIFDPLAMVCVRCRPEGHLVELASQVHKCDRETGFASTLEFDWEYGRVRLRLAINFLDRIVALRARGDDRPHAGFVCSDDEKELKRNRLQQIVKVFGSCKAELYVPADRP